MENRRGAWRRKGTGIEPGDQILARDRLRCKPHTDLAKSTTKWVMPWATSGRVPGR